ncbi:MAG: hypothetical protein ABIQ12_01975 [Opitutaceae bacterium]
MGREVVPPQLGAQTRARSAQLRQLRGPPGAFARAGEIQDGGEVREQVPGAARRRAHPILRLAIKRRGDEQSGHLAPRVHRLADFVVFRSKKS